MSQIIDSIKQQVQEASEDLDWNYHIVSVVRYALTLADLLHADKDVVELAAYLHDIGRQKNDSEEEHEFIDEHHHTIGEHYAREILEEHQVSLEIIDRVCLCIRRHRASGTDLPQTLEEKIIANADAMSHVEMIPLFFYWKAPYLTYQETLIWVKKKLVRDWEEKLTLPEAKELIRHRFEAAKELLGF